MATGACCSASGGCFDRFQVRLEIAISLRVPGTRLYGALERAVVLFACTVKRCRYLCTYDTVAEELVLQHREEEERKVQTFIMRRQGFCQFVFTNPQKFSLTQVLSKQQTTHIAASIRLMLGSE